MDETECRACGNVVVALALLAAGCGACLIGWLLAQI